MPVVLQPFVVLTSRRGLEIGRIHHHLLLFQMQVVLPTPLLHQTFDRLPSAISDDPSLRRAQPCKGGEVIGVAHDAEGEAGDGIHHNVIKVLQQLAHPKEPSTDLNLGSLGPCRSNHPIEVVTRLPPLHLSHHHLALQILVPV